MTQIYLKLLLFSLIPVALSILFYLLEQKTGFKKIPYKIRQIIIGIAFGCAAILGTTFGAPIQDPNNSNIIATANVRDAMPIAAALLFGGPAGIIAGLIGGIERIFTPLWGEGQYSVVACSISTILSGVYALGIRKLFSKNKNIPISLGIATAIVVEVIHMILLFLTKLNDFERIPIIIEMISFPMIFSNAIGVGLSCAAISILDRKNRVTNKSKPLSTKIQVWLLLVVVLSMLASTSIFYAVGTSSAYQTTINLLNRNVEDVTKDVRETSDFNLLNQADKILSQLDDDTDLIYLLDKFDVSEINIIQLEQSQDGSIMDGRIVKTTNPDWQDYYMIKSDQTGQSKEFHENMIDHYLQDGRYAQDYRPIGGDEIGATYFKYAGVWINQTSYLQVGLNEELFSAQVGLKMYEMSSYRHIKETGFIIIFDKDGNLVSNVSVEKKDVGISVDELTKYKEKTMDRRSICKQDVFFMYSTSETFYIVLCLPYNEVLSQRDSMMYLNSFVLVIIFAALYIIIYLLLKFLFVKKIDLVNDSLHQITSGNLDIKIEETSSLEFEALSNSINLTVNKLKDYIEEAKQRIDKELAMAKEIQSNCLPSTFPAFPDRKEFDIYALMKTAKEVGGDFYDFYIINQNTLAFLVADVSGKGIPAALFMMQAKAIFRNFAISTTKANEIMESVNNAICKDNKANMFVTCWFGTLDLKTGHLSFANAGHNTPLIYRKDSNTWSYISQKKNLVLGAIEGCKYDLQEIELGINDKIFLYTDGVTEATRSDNTLYGEERLKKYLDESKENSLNNLLQGLSKNLDVFIEEANQFDDITMLVVEFLKNSKK